MIVKLKGFIEDWFEDFVDLDVKGVVYRVFVPKKNIKKISEKGSLTTFFIFEILKESERLFFGFLNKNDRELFSDLLKVQGVGGKMALNIMSNLDSEVIQQSIISKNQSIFKKHRTELYLTGALSTGVLDYRDFLRYVRMQKNQYVAGLLAYHV